MVQEPPLLQWSMQVRQLGATRPSVQLWKGIKVWGWGLRKGICDARTGTGPGGAGWGGARMGHTVATGQNVEVGPPLPHSLAGDISRLLIDHTGSLETATTLVHLTPRSLKVDSASTLSGAIGGHLTRAKVLTEA